MCPPYALLSRVTVGADPHVEEVPVKCVVGGLHGARDGRPDVHTEVGSCQSSSAPETDSLSSMIKMTIQISAYTNSIST